MAGRSSALPKDWFLLTLGHAEALAAIRRFHSLEKTFNPTLNVAMHVQRVSFLASLLRSFLEKQRVTVDKLKVMEMGFLHDDLEVITGDFPSPEKRDSARRKEILRVERRAAGILDRRFRGIPQSISYGKLRKELDEKKTLESQIVDVADHLDGLGETLCEIILGNDSFFRVLEEYGSVFEEFDRRYPWWRRIKGKWGLEEFFSEEKALEIKGDESLAPAFYKLWESITVRLILSELAHQERMEKLIAEMGAEAAATNAKEGGDTGA